MHRPYKKNKIKMSWNNILGQSRVKLILSNAIRNNRISSSYIFTGTEGIGKEFVAIEFAKSVNCDNKFYTDDNLINACNKCKSCITIDNFSNNKIQLIYAMPTPKSTSEDSNVKYTEEQYKQIEEQISLKVKNKYHKINITGANQIKIGAVRELKKKLAYSTSEGGRRFSIIINSEDMTTEAANAFLKTLEEPNENTTIILISSSPEKILQTIMSRCQEIKFEPIEKDILINHLIEKYSKSDTEARLIANFSQGSLSKSYEFIDEDIQQLRVDIVDLLRSCIKRKFRIELVKEIEILTASKDKNKVELALKLLIIWIRDVVLITKTSLVDNNNMNQEKFRDLITNKDQEEIITKFASSFGKADFVLINNKIEETIRKIFQNVNLNLTLIDLFLEIRKLLLKSR